jgi:hypothetical protein
MPEPVTTITLAAVGMAAITEGIKFLYDQASELLKWRREKRKAAEGTQTTPSPQPTLMPRPEIFEPATAQPSVDEGTLERIAEPMGELCDGLSGIVAGRIEVDTNDAALVSRVDALRKALELVTGQPLTFRGETRPEGPTVRGRVNADAVLGEVVGVAAGTIAAGTTVGEVTAKTVHEKGSAVGVKVDRIG